MARGDTGQMMTLMSRLDGPPLDPSSEQARQWVRDELAGGQYVTRPSVWQRLLEWLLDLFGGGTGPGLLPGWTVALVVVAVLAVVALVVVRLVRPETSIRRAGRTPGAIDDEGLSAADYRARAREATGRGDWDTALLDAYRAIAAGAVERTLLAELPGRTAHEVAVDLAPIFPDHGAALSRAAASFDDVRYGHRPTTREQAAATAELETVLQQTRPRLGQLAGR